MVMARIHDDDNVVGGITTGDWVSPPPPRPPTPLLEEEDDDDDDDDDGISSKLISEIPTTPPVSGQKKNSGSCLSERVSARAGFTAPPRLNTESIVMENNATRSPYLTIPPGLSPTTLLDSPIFLSNSQAQPSPTTGKFPPLLSSSNGRRISEDNLFDDITTSSSFSFKPVPEESTASFLLLGVTNKQSFPSVDHVSVRPENALHSQFVDPSKNRNILNMHAHADLSKLSPEKDNASSDHSPHLDELQDEQGDQRGSGDSMACSGGAAAPSDDGYNWRKYGQKQVKGSEFPRSYYKCTHPSCQVKKKVERSHEGHITEIIYKGAHNHPKPQPNRRPSNPLVDVQSHVPEHTGPKNCADGETGWASAAIVADWRHDNTEVTSSTTLVPEYGDGTTSLQVPQGSNVESGDAAVDASSTFSNDEDEDDRKTHGSVSLGNNGGEGDESESKRRKIEALAAEMSGGASRAIREPRVVVQTTSDVDILDDGYRWRKYGQKVVKGNPNPRSYYKCTSAGCTVRKHVERASHDLKSVITTYEGKHNHDVPAARNSNSSSSHANSSVGTTQAVQSNIQQPEPSQIHGSMVRATSYCPFTLLGGTERQQQQLGPSSAFPFGMNQPGLANPFVGMGMATQQRQMGFILPKGEAMMMMMMEPIPETGLNLSNNSSAVYQQMISRLPLGPHM